MILNYKTFGKQNKESGSVLCARMGGVNIPSSMAAHFAKRNTKNCSGEKTRAGRILSPDTLFLPTKPTLIIWILSKIVSLYPINTAIFSKLGFWTIVASPSLRSGSASAVIFKRSGFAERSETASSDLKNSNWRCILKLVRTEFSCRASRGSEVAE